MVIISDWKNRFNSLLCYLCISLLSPIAASAWVNEKFSRNLVNDVWVLTQDEVSGGCWTNLKQSREYAEEKLRSKGYNVTAQRGSEYIFLISAVGFRDSTGWCVASITISLETLALVDDVMAVSATIGRKSGVTQIKNNINNDVTDYISDLMNDL